jgi:RNA polymerase sigma-70 factor (ECF subfamily)
VPVHEGVVGVATGLREHQCLFRAYDALHAFVSPRVRAEDVQDILQDVFARALSKERSFTKSDALHAWLCGIARKVICERGRQERSRPRGDFANLGLSDTESLEPQPHASAEASETLQAIRETLARLPPEARRLLVWHCEEKRTVKQIASVLEIGVRAVRSRIHRARALFATDWRRQGRSVVAPAT